MNDLPCHKFPLFIFLFFLSGCAYLKSPHVWAPVAAAGAIAISGSDKKISQWATDHTPIFGSHNNADGISTNINHLLLLETATSVLLTPEKLKGGVVAFVSIKAAENTNRSM